MRKHYDFSNAIRNPYAKQLKNMNPYAPAARRVSVSAENLVVELTDGRVLSVPIAWYPRLQHGSLKERRAWQLIGGGEGIHWPDLDEDISVEGLVAGRPSGEGHASLARWLKSRMGTRRCGHGRNLPIHKRK